KVNGVVAPVPRPAPAVVTELRPQPAAAFFRARLRAGAEVARNAPRIPGDAKPRSEDRWAPARVGRSGLRSQRRGLLAVDTRRGVSFPVGRQPANGSGGDSPTDC